MQLSKDDANLFYKLYGSLMAFANRQLRLVSNLEAASQIRQIDFQELVKLRARVYADDKILAAVVAQNPDGLSAAELDILASWKHRLGGKFYIARYLKKYTVFQGGGEPGHLYGVLGISNPIEEVLYGRPVPIYVDAVLLPFKGQIIYDSLLQPYNIFFGGGISRSVKQSYNRLKVREGIIESLVGPDGAPSIGTSLKAKAKKPAADWRPAVAEIVSRTEIMRNAETPIENAALSLLRAAAAFAQAALDNPADADGLQGQLKPVRRAMTKLETALFDEFYE
jgi:hypothetical protein